MKIHVSMMDSTMLTFWNIGVAAMLAVPGMDAVAAAGDVDGREETLLISGQERIHATEQFIGSTKKLSLERLKRDQQRFPDGAIGYTTSESIRPRWTNQNVRQKYFSRAACNGELTGLVEVVGAQSISGIGNNGIFTKFRFRVLDDWRVQPAPSRPYIDILMHVGEITYAGERYRVENPEAGYRVGKQYILLTGKSSKSPAGSLLGAPAFLEVRDGVIYPVPSVTHFAAGTTVAQAKAEVDNAVRSEGCQ